MLRYYIKGIPQCYTVLKILYSSRLLEHYRSIQGTAALHKRSFGEWSATLRCKESYSSV